MPGSTRSYGRKAVTRVEYITKTYVQRAKRARCPRGRQRPQGCRLCDLEDCVARDHRFPWQPSREQIAAACEAIQSTWSERERHSRRCYGSFSRGLPVGWEVPAADLPDRRATA